MLLASMASNTRNFH